MPDITAPNAGAYGIFSPAYAASLVQSRGNAGADILNRWALRSHAGAEQGQYDEALQRTQAAQRELAMREIQAELEKTYLQQIAPMAAQGVGGAVSMPTQSFSVDAPYLQNADATFQAERAADTQLARAQALGEIAPIGVMPAEAEMAPYLGLGQAPREGYMTPDATSERMRAEAAQKQAEASMVAARRPPSGGGGDSSGRLTATYSPSQILGMNPEYTVRGPVDLVEEYRRRQEGNQAPPPNAVRLRPRGDGTFIDPQGNIVRPR